MRAQLYLMFSTVSSGMGATVCTAGRFLLVGPLTKPDEEAVVAAASVAPDWTNNVISLTGFQNFIKI